MSTGAGASSRLSEEVCSTAAGIGADLLGFDGLATRLRTVGAEAQAAHGGLLALWRPEP